MTRLRDAMPGHDGLNGNSTGTGASRPLDRRRERKKEDARRELARVAREIVQYKRDVKAGLESLKRRTHFEAATTKTPLSELIGNEDDSLEEWAIRSDAIRRFLIYCGQDGADPRDVMRAFYAVACHMGVEPFCLLTARERGFMLGDSHGAEHWRTKKMAVDPCRRNGAHSFKAPGGKGLEASAIAADAQRGNQNRRKHKAGRNHG